MVTSCCHGNMKSSDCGLKLLFYIRGNNGLCKIYWKYVLETVGSLLKEVQKRELLNLSEVSGIFFTGQWRRKVWLNLKKLSNLLKYDIVYFIVWPLIHWIERRDCCLHSMHWSEDMTLECMVSILGDFYQRAFKMFKASNIFHTLQNQVVRRATCFMPLSLN